VGFDDATGSNLSNDAGPALSWALHTINGPPRLCAVFFGNSALPEHRHRVAVKQGKEGAPRPWRQAFAREQSTV